MPGISNQNRVWKRNGALPFSLTNLFAESRISRDTRLFSPSVVTLKPEFFRSLRSGMAVSTKIIWPLTSIMSWQWKKPPHCLPKTLFL
jgi:hypothetical protein